MKILRSLSFNVALFIVIAAASAVGTLLPQWAEGADRVRAFLAAHPGIGPLLDRLGFFRLYEAPWYLALLGLMAVDVVLCKLRGGPKRVHGESTIDERLIAASPLKAQRTLGCSWGYSVAAIRERLRRSGFALREGAADGEAYFWAAKHRAQRWGDFLLHVSVVVLIAAGFLGGARGFTEMLPVAEGAQRPMARRPWTVAVDRFRRETYPGTDQVRSFESDVRIIDGDGVRASGRLAVNRPLTIDGVRFYQAAWGETGLLRSATLVLGDGGRLRLPFRQPTALPGTGLTLSADMYQPDFSLDDVGRVIDGGSDPRNPAVLIRFYEAGRLKVGVWLLARRPGVSFREQSDGTVEAAGAAPFHLAALDPVAFSGIQAAYDPGASLAALGATGLVIGLCLHFYLHQRRVRVLARARSDGTTDVWLGGWNSRRVRDFESEFQRLVKDVESL